jgi:hypothetical protein
MNTKQTFYLLVASMIILTACRDNCESGVAFGKIEGTVLLVGTSEPAEGVKIQLVENEITGGYPPSTNSTLLQEAYTNSNGNYNFSQKETGPFANLDVFCNYNSSLFWEVKKTESNGIRQTDCGIRENFVLYPKAKLEVKIGNIKMPENATKGYIYNGKSDTSMVFSKDNLPTGSIIFDVVGNVSDTFYLRFDKLDTIYNAQYPNGYAYDVKDRLIKIPFRVDAWKTGEYILNYP